MIVDTSAWVEYLRATGSAAHLRLREQIAQDGDVLVHELVAMELLVGVAGEGAARRLRSLLHTFQVIPLAAVVDSERAAALQRRCRGEGQPVRNMIDCLIAATAIRVGEPVLHADRDFEVLSAVSELKLVAV